MKLLTLEEIIEINKEVGENGTMINKGNLEFIISKLKEAKSLDKVASTVFYEIINLHPFLDGNKRTAYVSMKTIIELNGKHIKQVPETEIEELIYQIAQNKYSINQTQEILKMLII